MLVSKAQGVATWKRLYPPGLETLTTDDLTVVMPTDDTIVIHGDNNINTDGSNAPGIVTINLNNSILLPATTGPTVGVIALGTSLFTDRFMHNFGDDNCFVGNSSGNFSLTGSSNTGIGTDVLNSTTSGSNNSACGFESLFSLTSGGNNSAFGYVSLGRITSGNNNLALGVIAGSVYSTESSNVVIANSGMSGDQNTIRIGTQGTGSAQQNVAYMAGITGTTTTTVTAKTLLNVGTDGQLGETLLYSSDNTVVLTSAVVAGKNTLNLQAAAGGGGSGGNPFAFQYYEPTLQSGVGSLNYTLGNSSVLTKVYDVGNTVFPGDGANDGMPATFTAPVTGTYFISFTVGLTSSTAGTLAVNAIIEAPLVSYVSNSTIIGTSLTLKNSAQAVAVVQLNMNDVVTFRATTTGGAWAYAQGDGVTYIQGFLISQGEGGGDFTQPFFAVQQVDAVNVTGDGTEYLLGSAAPIVPVINVGSNFSPGNGAGIPAQFIAPATGTYSFSASVQNSGYNSPTALQFYLKVNGVFAGNNYYAQIGAAGIFVNPFNPIDLMQGQTVTWAFLLNQSVPLLNVSVLANTTTLGTIYNTLISGYRLA